MAYSIQVRENSALNQKLPEAFTSLPQLNLAIQLAAGH